MNYECTKALCEGLQPIKHESLACIGTHASGVLLIVPSLYRLQEHAGGVRTDVTYFAGVKMEGVS